MGKNFLHMMKVQLSWLEWQEAYIFNLLLSRLRKVSLKVMNLFSEVCYFLLS